MTAWRRIMRAVLAGLLLGACLGGCVGAGVSPAASGARPGVMPMLSELPSDAAKRNAILDSSANVAGPEQRGSLTVKEQAAETVGATAAAVLGSLFSKTQNVTLGAAGNLEEAPVGGAHHAGPPRAPSVGPTGAAAPVAPANPDTDPPNTDPPNTDLIPWIKLH